MTKVTFMGIKATVNNFEVWVYPKYDSSLHGQFDATVEAEYGEMLVEGKSITLAHHGSRADQPAPCLCPICNPLDSGKILCSHFDLDTIGGVLEVMGIKPDEYEFWNGAAFIDVAGPHNFKLLRDTTVEDELNAWYAFNEQQKEKYPFKPGEPTLINEQLIDATVFLYDLFYDFKYREKYINAGRVWRREITTAVESRLEKETAYVRMFKTDSVFCNGSYYSPTMSTIIPAVVALNTKTNAVTLSFEDGGKIFSAEEIVKELWGNEAGGRAGIGGSPRGLVMTMEDATQLFDIVDKKLRDYDTQINPKRTPWGRELEQRIERENALKLG